MAPFKAEESCCAETSMIVLHSVQTAWWWGLLASP